MTNQVPGLGDLTTHVYFLQFWRLEVPDHGAGRILGFSGGLIPASFLAVAFCEPTDRQQTPRCLLLG